MAILVIGGLFFNEFSNSLEDIDLLRSLKIEIPESLLVEGIVTWTVDENFNIAYFYDHGNYREEREITENIDEVIIYNQVENKTYFFYEEVKSGEISSGRYTLGNQSDTGFLDVDRIIKRSQGDVVASVEELNDEKVLFVSYVKNGVTKSFWYNLENCHLVKSIHEEADQCIYKFEMTKVIDSKIPLSEFIVLEKENYLFDINE